MSINRITGPDRVSPTSTPMDPAASSAASVLPVDPSAPVVDRLTQQTPPARFPWLNRLSQRLEAASRQPATFPAAPTLGDSLDQAA